MKTLVVKITTENIEKQVHNAARLIKEGGLVAFPTETVYGLGADALNPQAARRIYQAKGRPSDNPLIVHIADPADLAQIAEKIPQRAMALGERFWPGPLTMIFPKKDCVPLATTGGLDTVAVRMPDHPVALALIAASTGFIAAPSANASGRPSPTLAEHVYFDLNGRIPMILDGGPVGLGLESTIIDFSEEIPVILRPGFITKEMAEAVIGEVRLDPGLKLGEAQAPKAPGMKYRHYAPRAEMILVKGCQDQVVRTINHLIEETEKQGKKVGVISTDETYRCYPRGIVKNIGARKEEAVIARNLYGILREFDQLDVDRIYSESFSEQGLGQAVMNRMLKAAGHRVIEV